MVSKARDDLPEPETPVTTVSALWGISKSMFLRLWTRAPRTTIDSLEESIKSVISSQQLVISKTKIKGKTNNKNQKLTGNQKGNANSKIKMDSNTSSDSGNLLSRVWAGLQ